VDLKESARGPLKVDDFGNPIQNIYIRKVERVGGRLQNTVIATYPAVSQFWKYKPDEYMKRPLYGRDYRLAGTASEASLSEPLALRLERVSKAFGGLRAVDAVELAVRRASAAP